MPGHRTLQIVREFNDSAQIKCNDNKREQNETELTLQVCEIKFDRLNQF